MDPNSYMPFSDGIEVMMMLLGLLYGLRLWIPLTMLMASMTRAHDVDYYSQLSVLGGGYDGIAVAL